jgi:hypothetical protein
MSFNLAYIPNIDYIYSYKSIKLNQQFSSLNEFNCSLDKSKISSIIYRRN